MRRFLGEVENRPAVIERTIKMSHLHGGGCAPHARRAALLGLAPLWSALKGYVHVIQ